jgi:hypothetical protein
MRKDLRKYMVYGVLPLAGTAAGGAIFSDFVINAIKTNVALNGKIIVTMAIGAALMYFRMWQMLREDKALRQFSKVAAASRKLEQAKAAAALAELLHAKSFAKTDVRKVLEPAVQTGGRINSRVEQAAIEHEMHAMREVMESRWELPTFLVGFMVALGLLGTFIGLLETLVGTSALIGSFGGQGNLDEAIAKLVTGLREPLAGMGTAFSASMFGLVASSVLGLIMIAVRALGSALMNNVRAAVDGFAERASGATGVMHGLVGESYLANAMADMIDLQREAQDTFGRAMEATLSVSARTDGVMRKLDELAAAVAEQSKALARTNELMGVGPRMRELAEQTLSESKAVVARMLMQSAATERLQRAMEAIDTRLAAQHEGTTREREVLRSALVSMTESEAATRASLAVAREEDRADRDAQVREIRAMRQSTLEASAAMSTWGTRMGSLQDVASAQLALVEREATAIERMTGAIEALARQIAATAEQSGRDAQAGRQAQIDVAKQLSGLGTVLRVANEQVVEHMTRLAETSMQHTATSNAVAQEIRLLRSGLGREVRREVREALSSTRAVDERA